MKNYILLLLAAFALALVGCKTSEENYKAAYDKAVARTQENVGQEAYDKVQAEKRRYTEVVNGDSVRVVRAFCNIVDGTAADVKKYSVVVAVFDQLINARSYRDRLREQEGFESYVVINNTDKKYHVILQGFDDKPQAAAFIRNLQDNPAFIKMKILVPIPWILERR